MYLEVLEWEPPSSAGRPLVVLGGVALPAAVAAPAALPPAAPAGDGEPLAHPADPLPLVAGANTPRGAFFEVRRGCHTLLQNVHVCLQGAQLGSCALVLPPAGSYCARTLPAGV